MKNVSNPYRKFVVGVDTKIPLPTGKYVTAINFDNAATTPPLQSVLMEINRFAPWYSSIHRGTGYKSQLSSYIYETTRKLILNFVNGDPASDTVIYVKNTTEAINRVAHDILNETGIILSTSMEHHSNDLPWRNKYKVEYIEIDELGRLKLEDLEEKLSRYKNSKKLLAITGASNVTGIKNPLNTIANLCYTYDAKLLVDGAQLVPHAAVDISLPSSKGKIDYLVFSGHKMYAPFGTGVLIGPKEVFNRAPLISGGGAVDLVTHDYVKWADPPAIEEAGTPNLMGVVALAAAIKALNAIGMEGIISYEESLTSYTLSKLSSIDGIELYGDPFSSDNRVAIVPFNIRGIPHEVTARALSYEGGIAVRSGCFCAHPYVQRLLKVPLPEMEKRIKNPHLPHPGMVRISFGLYNTYAEVDLLIDILNRITKNRSYYYNIYSNIDDLYFPSH